MFWNFPSKTISNSLAKIKASKKVQKLSQKLFSQEKKIPYQGECNEFLWNRKWVLENLMVEKRERKEKGKDKERERKRKRKGIGKERERKAWTR